MPTTCADVREEATGLLGIELCFVGIALAVLRGALTLPAVDI